MPNETISIERFNGIFSKADSRDIPDTAAIYSMNQDPESPLGRLQAILDKKTLYPNYNGMERSCFIEKSKDLYSLIYSTGNSVRVREDFYGTRNFYGTSNETSFSLNSPPTALIAENHSARIAMGANPPMMIGYDKLDPFNGNIIYTPGPDIQLYDLSSLNKVTQQSNNLVIDQNGYEGTDTFIIQVEHVEYSSNYNREITISNDEIFLTQHGLTDKDIGKLVTIWGYKDGTEAAKSVYQIKSMGDKNGLNKDSAFVAEPLRDNDFINSGTYNTPDCYAGLPDVENVYIQWKKNSDAFSSTPILLTEAPYTLGTDIRISLRDLNSVHVAGDTWTISYAEGNLSLYYKKAQLDNFRQNKLGDDVFVNLTITPDIKGTSTNYLFSNKKYYYAYSINYQGQESPLAYRTDGDNITVLNVSSTEYYNRITIKFSINYKNNGLRGATGVKLWRAEGSVDTYLPGTKFRMVGEVDFRGWNSDTPPDGYSTKYYMFYDVDQLGGMYEAYTSMPETVDSIINYTIGCTINGKLAVAGCTTNYFDDATKLIFFSKPGCLDQFDPLHDFVKVDFVPLALASFDSKLYAFGKNVYARINPEGLYVENTYWEHGIYSDQSLLVTESGMYWCDKNGAYWNDGQTTRIITDIIHGKIESTNKQWADIFTGDSDPIRIVYSVEKRSIIFMNVSNGQAWVYHSDGQWFYWNFNLTASTVPYHLFAGKQGEVYLVANDTTGATYFVDNRLTNITMNILFQGNYYLPLEWKSKNFTMGDGLQPKKFYKILLSGNCSLFFGINNNGTVYTLQQGYIDVAYRRGNSIQFFLTGAGGSTKFYVDNLSCIFRRLNVQ